MIALRSAAATDTGVVRTNNEDLALAEEPLFAVADGMGGHAAGEVASRVAIDAFRAAAGDGMVQAVVAANAAVLARAGDDPNLRGMGTTLCALTLLPGEDGAAESIEIVNVGDSRGYLLRDGELSQVTEDHNVPAELYREGRLRAEEVRHHPQRNIVTRVLGSDPEVIVDRFVVDPFRGDRYLLCSDGLCDELEDDVIAEVLRDRRDPESAVAELVQRARDAGGHDNITVVVVDVVDDGGRSGAASTALHGTAVGRAVPAAAKVSTGAVGTAGSTPAIAAPGRRLTWRAVAFTLAVLVVLAGAIGGVWWFGRGSYYVGVRGGEVTIFKGRPGGVLWLDPTVEQRTGIELSDVPVFRRAALREGEPEPSLDAARKYVARLERDAAPTTTTTSTTVAVTPDAATGGTATTETSVPAAPAPTG